MLNAVHEVIGETPMVHLSRIARAFGVEGDIYAKLEYLNPGFSKKDRVALAMIEEAEAAGLLKPGPDRCRAHQWKHGNRACHRVRVQGISIRGLHVQG